MKPFIGFRDRVSELSETYRKPSEAIKIAEDSGNPTEVSDTSETHLSVPLIYPLNLTPKSIYPFNLTP